MDAATAESEDSLSDEYTLVVEEVHTEEIPAESSDALMLKHSISGTNVLDEETSVDLHNDLNDTADSRSRPCSPDAVNNASKFEEIALVEEITANANNNTAVSETNDVKNSSSKPEENLLSPVMDKKVESNPVCNGTVDSHKIREDSTENIQCKRKDSEVPLKKILSCTQDSVIFRSNNSVDKLLSPKNMSESCRSIIIGEILTYVNVNF